MYNKLQGLLLLATITTPLSVYAKSKLEPQQSRGIDSPRIVGGQETAEFAYPFMGSLQLDNGHFCGLSFIGDNKVLTASHCIEGIPAERFTVKFEGHDLTDDSQWQTYNIVSMSMHDQYNMGMQYNNDIAVLELDRPVENIKPIKLADQVIRNSLVAGDNLKVMGWGRLSSGGESPDKLQEVDVPYVTNELCNSEEYYNGRISDSMICAGLAEGGKDSCQGDSGGPLIVQKNDEWFQVGVVSWGEGCALPNKPGVYADVESLFYWVQSKTSDFGFGQNESHVYTEDKPSFAIQNTFKNTLDYPLAIAEFSLSQHAEGVQLSEQNCANTVLEPDAQCQFTVLTPDGSKHDKYTVQASITSPSTSLYSAVFGYTKLTQFEESINEMMSTPSSVKWSTGGDENWYVGKTPEQEPTLVSGDVTDRDENPEVTEPYQESTLMINIDDLHIKDISFDYLVSSELGYDVVGIFHNGKQVLIDSGDERVYKPFNVELIDGVNQIRIEYLKDYIFTVGNDNVALKNFDTTFVNTEPTIELAQTELDVRSELEFTLDASATTDRENDTITYSWVKLADEEQQVGEESVVTLKAEKTTEDLTVTYQLTATDEYEASSTALVKVNIIKNNAPTLSLTSSSSSVHEGEAITINVVDAKDPDGDNVTISWEQTSGPSVTLPGNQNQFNFTAPDVNETGPIVFTVTATDEFGLSQSETVSVEVKNVESGSLGIFSLFMLALLTSVRRVKK
ncbi:trypsin-like serine protease [Pseudoalteromonas luteoviolacea]|uniref:serine protease n=1 Tax=Pseudoalteromonas luteoviolacea TaxID=43657 RepID=UPI001B366894|nr:serine protease [Pseudoalteromonas luteoviolacea]MBQ4811092.1 trypsin-like serine protease [Pseudoalteromonas luteoviolacea]